MAHNLELFDQKYKATTPFDGVYVGRVVGHEGSSRKRVLIEGVLTPALPLELGGVRRRGYRLGEVIELPGHAVKPTEAVGTDYLSAVRNQVVECSKKSDALAKAYLQVLSELQRNDCYES